MSVPYILTETAASVFIDFTPYTVPNTHPNWDKILEALGDPDTTDDVLRPLLDVAHGVSEYLQGAVEYRDRLIFWNGEALDNRLTRRIIKHMQANQPGLAKPPINFLEKVMENPSYRAVQGLYDWVELAELPITPEGDVLAYKIVRDDFKDLYSGTFDNSPGLRVEIARHKVDEDPDRTCSRGLHVCSKAYLPHYGSGGSKVVIVKIHPKDFVAVPRDYNTSKARVAGYDVLREVSRETAGDYFSDSPWVWAETKFQVGQRWETRDGNDVVEIISIDHQDDESNGAIETIVRSGQHEDEVFTYTLEGTCFWDEEDDSDLITLVSEG